MLMRGMNKTPLVAALHRKHFRVDITELLHQHGADIHVRGCHEFTPLHAATAGGRVDVAQWPFDHDADVNAQTVDLWTPLHVAVS